MPTDSVRYFLYTLRAERGWKLANGNLDDLALALAALDEARSKDDVIDARLQQVTTATI
jgi:hypothetical protein